ncbi:hypothetical protein IWX50DRAFT_124722 [Phyllosticta citricarpa]
MAAVAARLAVLLPPVAPNVNLWGLITAPSVSLPWLVYSHHSDSTFRLEPRYSYLTYDFLSRVVPSHSTVDSWPKAKRNAVRSSALALSSRRPSISPGRACGAEKREHSTGYPVRSFSPGKHVRHCIAQRRRGGTNFPLGRPHDERSVGIRRHQASTQQSFMGRAPVKQALKIHTSGRWRGVRESRDCYSPSRSNSQANGPARPGRPHWSPRVRGGRLESQWERESQGVVEGRISAAAGTNKLSGLMRPQGSSAPGRYTPCCSLATCVFVLRGWGLPLLLPLDLTSSHPLWAVVPGPGPEPGPLAALMALVRCPSSFCPCPWWPQSLPAAGLSGTGLWSSIGAVLACFCQAGRWTTSLPAATGLPEVPAPFRIPVQCRSGRTTLGHDSVSSHLDGSGKALAHDASSALVIGK